MLAFLLSRLWTLFGRGLLPSVLLFAGESKLQASAVGLISSREINLTPHQLEALAADQPVAAIALSERALWMAGRTALWRWTVHSQKLTRVGLGERPGAPIRQLLAVEGRIYAASDRELFEIRLAPSLRVFRFDTPELTPAESLALAAHEEAIYWLKGHAAYRLDGKLRTLALWKEHAPWTPPPTAAYAWLDPNHLWFTDDNRLMQVDYSAAQAKPSELYQTKYRFTGLERQGEHVLVHTQHTVLLMNRAGEPVRTIPVEGQRRLVQMALNASYHTYLFHDRLIERHALASQSTHYSYLDIGRVKKAGPMISEGSLVALVLDGMPRIFQLEGAW